MTLDVPSEKLVPLAFVETIRMDEVEPGGILAPSGGPNENPTTLPAALRSAVIGKIVPAENGPTASPRVATQVVQPKLLLKSMLVSRATLSQIGCPEPPQFVEVALMTT
jgi:hypothetical protein